MRTWNLNLPNKPLKFKKAGAISAGQTLLIMPFSLLVGAAFLWWCTVLGKDIQRDHQIGKDFVVVEDARVTGECKSKFAVLVSCQATIRHKGEIIKKNLYFFDLGSGDYATDVIAPRDNPQELTLSIAADKVAGRIGTLALLAALGLLCVLGFFMGMFVRLPRERNAVASLNRSDAQPWQLVEMDLELTKTGAPKHYFMTVNGKTQKMGHPFKKNQEPFVVDVNGTTATILGFAPKNGGGAIPLDQKLTYISGLSKQEKAQLADDIRRLMLVNQVN